MMQYRKSLHQQNYHLLLLTEKNIKQFAVYYLACFLFCYAWFAYDGLLFSLIKPIFFYNRPDITHNVMMLSGLQQQLLQSQWLRITVDIIYLVLPVLLLYTCIKNKKWQPFFAIVTAVFNIWYGSFFSTMSFVSVENFIAWMFIPLLFYARTTKGFYYGLHSCRLLFILIFFSTALWKLRAGGIFNIEEMSAVLFRQHAAYLAIHTPGWYDSLLRYLITHQTLSYCLYFFAFLAEFLFVVGFFTRKYDKYLIVLFCFFVLTDYLLMGINYFPWLPFMGCFYFSKAGIKEAVQAAR
jgi:hypothetical protein